MGHKTIAESMKGNGEIIKMLLETGITNIDFRDCYGDISLIITALHRQENFLKLLLDISTNVNAMGSKQCTILQAGSGNGHENMVEILPDCGLRHHTGSFGENTFYAFDNLARAHECNLFEEAQRITWTTCRGLTVRLTRETSRVPKTLDLYLIARESLLSDEAIWTEQSKMQLYRENSLSLGNRNQVWPSTSRPRATGCCNQDVEESHWPEVGVQFITSESCTRTLPSCTLLHSLTLSCLLLDTAVYWTWPTPGQR